VSRPLVAAALALAGLALTPAARAQEQPYDPPQLDAPPPPQGQIIVVVPPGYGPGYGPYLPAPPPAVPYYAQPLPPLPPAAEPRALQQDGFTMKLWAGPAYRRLFDVSIAGADVGAFFGGEHRGVVWSGGIGAVLGRTDQGLSTYQIRPGASFETHLDRVRLGLGLDFSWLGITRATTGDMMTGLSLGGQLFGTVDLVQSGRHALYLGAKLSGEWFTTHGGGSTPFMWGPSGAVGFRY
jgi:hypothetical protein